MINIIDEDISLLIAQLEVENGGVSPLTLQLLHTISNRLQNKNHNIDKTLLDIRLLMSSSKAYKFQVKYLSDNREGDWEEIAVY